MSIKMSIKMAILDTGAHVAPSAKMAILHFLVIFLEDIGVQIFESCRTHPDPACVIYCSGPLAAPIRHISQPALSQALARSKK